MNCLVSNLWSIESTFVFLRLMLTLALWTNSMIHVEFFEQGFANDTVLHQKCLSKKHWVLQLLILMLTFSQHQNLKHLEIFWT